MGRDGVTVNAGVGLSRALEAIVSPLGSLSRVLTKE